MKQTPNLFERNMKNLRHIPYSFRTSRIVKTRVVFDEMQRAFTNTFFANIKSPLDYIIDSQKTDNEHITKLKT